MSTFLRTCRRFALALSLVSLFSISARAASYVGIDLYTLQTPAGLTRISPQDALGGQVGGWGAPAADNFHALLWSGPSGTAVDLGPSGFATSQVKAIDTAQQVGFGRTSSDNSLHALLWSGTAASAIDLNPSGFTQSQAFAVGAGEQVGSASSAATSNNPHAMLWSGTAASAIDLHPSGYDSSAAKAVTVGQQVGQAATGGNNHAILWTGSAASAVDLNPVGATISFALGVGGGQQVGDADFPGFSTHAGLWLGTAASFVDLNPSGATISDAYAVGGGVQVGDAQVNGGFGDAFLWTGSTASAVDLGLLLPAADRVSSIALSIDGSGNVFGYAEDNSGKLHAVEWSPVPEPSTFVLMGLAGGMTWWRRGGCGCRCVRIGELMRDDWMPPVCVASQWHPFFRFRTLSSCSFRVPSS